MKTGIILTAAALALFLATVLWSFTQHVPYKDLDDFGRKENRDGICGDELRPDKYTASACFYATGQCIAVDVDAPVNIVLDETFSGIAIEGDTGITKYLLVRLVPYDFQLNNCIAVRTNRGGEGGLEDPVSHKVEKTYRSYQEMISHAGIVLKIGIKPDPNHVLDREMRFSGYKTIRSQYPIRAKRLKIFTNESLNLQVDVEQLLLHANLGEDHIRLSGKTHSALYENIDTGTIDAQDLITEETYIVSCDSSKFNVHARILVNSRNVDPKNINISGNPPYQRID